MPTMRDLCLLGHHAIDEDWYFELFIMPLPPADGRAKAEVLGSSSCSNGDAGVAELLGAEAVMGAAIAGGDAKIFAESEGPTG